MCYYACTYLCKTSCCLWLCLSGNLFNGNRTFLGWGVHPPIIFQTRTYFSAKCYSNSCSFLVWFFYTTMLGNLCMFSLKVTIAYECFLLQTSSAILDINAAYPQDPWLISPYLTPPQEYDTTRVQYYLVLFFEVELAPQSGCYRFIYFTYDIYLYQLRR